MTTFTRAVSRVALTHVLDNILRRSSIREAIIKAVIEDTFTFLTLDDKAISELEYDVTDSIGITTKNKPQNSDIGLLKSFIHYVYVMMLYAPCAAALYLP
jgi:hypothetical protein